MTLQTVEEVYEGYKEDSTSGFKRKAIDNPFSFSRMVTRARRGILILPPASKINEGDCKSDPTLTALLASYGRCSELKTVEKAFVSMWHAIYQHKRFIFGLTREKMRAVVEEDPNWPEPVYFSNASYPSCLAMLENVGVKRLTNATSNKAGILLNTEQSELWNNMEGDQKEQLLQAWRLVRPHERDVIDKKIFEKFKDLRSISLGGNPVQ